ncbi:MAG: hypothetical protein HRU30_16325 [Rhodobacteraceae bacterium]|nr:hypothetical protein [Paracoccaceae bacterium]
MTAIVHQTTWHGAAAVGRRASAGPVPPVRRLVNDSAPNGQSATLSTINRGEPMSLRLPTGPALARIIRRPTYPTTGLHP